MEGKDTVLAFNRELAKVVGVSGALLYQELARKQYYWESQGKLNEEGMFWCDQKALADWLLMHKNTLGKIAAMLEEVGLIEKKISYRPGTLTPTTWWKVKTAEINKKVISRNQQKSDFHIKADTTTNTEDEGEEDVIPLATQDVRVSLYDTDENGKTVAIEHIIPRREWNKAVRKWRKSESESVLVTLKDTGATERMTFKRIKKFNVRADDTPKYKEGGGFVYAK